MERTEQGLEKALSELPGAVRGVPEGPARHRRRRLGQPDAGEGRPGRRLLPAGMLMCRDALERRESCGGHFRVEYQDDEGEAAARRRALRPRRRLGVDRRPDGVDPQRGAARVRSRAPGHAELQVSATTDGQPAAAPRPADHQPDAEDLAPEGPRRPRPLRDVQDRRDQRRGVVPGDARRAQRAADRREPRAGRVRPRLPRGHLRHVLADDRRPGPRPAAGHGDVPAAHAQVPLEHGDHRRAVAGDGVPDHQGPDGRPRRVRPDHRGRRVHHRARPAARPTPT